MVVRLFDSVMLDSDVQFLNAKSLILVTLFVIVTEDKLEQPSNTY